MALSRKKWCKERRACSWAACSKLSVSDPKKLAYAYLKGGGILQHLRVKGCLLIMRPTGLVGPVFSYVREQPRGRERLLIRHFVIDTVAQSKRFAL